jgi:uncharacterized protein (TIGR03546 family)
MILPTSLKKLVAIFRGEVSPILILLSVALGFWFGLTPGWYGVHVVLLVLALILNVHVGIFLMFAAIGKALCFAAAPVLFHVGKWAQGSLAPILDFFAALPIVGITDFARCSVAGSLIIGPVVGIVCGLLLARSVSAFRRAWLKLEENSDAFRKWHSNRWVRLLDRLLIGKRTKDVRSVLKRRPRIIRMAGVAVAVAVLIVSAVGLYFVQGDRLTDFAAASLTKANGAEVNLERLNLAVLSGKVSATGLQVTDPEKPANNRIAVAQLTADASLWDLSRGRLVMDDVLLAEVQFDQPRGSAGTLTAPRPEAPAPQFDPAQFDLAMVDIDKLETYFRKTEEARGWFEKLADWLPEGKEEAPPPPPPVPEHYLEYLTARAATPPTPRLVVKRAVLDDVRIPAREIGNSTITCTNLSDAPAAAGLPVTIALESKDRKTSLKIVCRYDRPEGGAEISGTVGDVDLRELQAELNPNNPVTFEGGTATAAISGAATRQTIDLGIQVQTQGMQARTAGGGLFGLDPQVTSEALRVLENVQTTLRLVGPTAQPRLVFDRPALTNEFKQALVNAGKAELARRVDDALAEQLPAGIPKTGDVLENPLGAAGDAVGALLSGQKQDKQEEDKQEEGKKKKEEAEKKEKDKDDALSRLKDRLKEKKKP